MMLFSNGLEEQDGTRLNQFSKNSREDEGEENYFDFISSSLENQV